MRFVAFFEDTPAVTAVRAQLRPAHIEFLRAHTDEILIAGGLREEPDAAFVGALWVMEVASRERAVTLIEADPFFRATRRPYRLLLWNKALPEVEAAL
jgi:hypothetical protein